MPSPSEVGHQEKEEDIEREVLTESHRQPSKRTSITTDSKAAYVGPVTEGTGSAGQGQRRKNTSEAWLY